MKGCREGTATLPRARYACLEFSAVNVRSLQMPTLIVILDDGTERRISEITRAVENNDAVVALNEQNHVKARFALRDVRSWYVEEDQQ